MGLVLDSSVLIDAERAAKPISDLLREIEERHGETEIIIPTLSALETNATLRKIPDLKVISL